VVVRRGVPRVTPGEPLPCPAPIGIGVDDHVAFLAFGVRAAVPFDLASMAAAWSDPTSSGAKLLAAASEAARGSGARAVLRSTETGDVQKVSV
jgi:hypothetical protein